jgi:hypothetical protein
MKQPRLLPYLAVIIGITLSACSTPPIISAFTATPNPINAAGTVKLNWDVQQATSISIDNGVGDVTGSSSKDVNITTTTTFTLIATNRGASVSKQLTVTVGATASNAAPTIVAFTSTPENLTAPGEVTLNWNVNGADKLTISDLGTVSPNGTGSIKTTLNATKSFVLTATNTFGATTKSVDIVVGPTTSSAGVWNSSQWNTATWQ